MQSHWWIGAAFHAEDQVRAAVPKAGSLGIMRADMWAANHNVALAKRFAEDEGIEYLADARSAREWFFDRGFGAGYADELADQLAHGAWVLVLTGHENAGEVIAALRSMGARIPQSREAAPELREQRIPLRRERLDVATYVVHEADVSVHKEIITEIHRFEVPVVREELVIQRYPAGVTEPATERILLRHEQLRLTKRTVVDEEVVVRRERTYVDQHVEQALRSETVRLQTSGDVPVHARVDEDGLLLPGDGTTSAPISIQGETAADVRRPA